jgi:DNA-binding transcriptional regulator YiaG
LWRRGKSPHRWKSRRAGGRALRYISYLPIRYVEVSEDVDVRAIRSKLGLSQAGFSRRYALRPRSLQEWEQGRRRPESAVRAYLTVIDGNPQAVEKALTNKS